MELFNTRDVVNDEPCNYHLFKPVSLTTRNVSDRNCMQWFSYSSWTACGPVLISFRIIIHSFIFNRLVPERGLNQTNKQPLMFRFTPMGNLDSPIDLTPDAQLWMGVGSQRIPRGKPANLKQKGPNLESNPTLLLWGNTANHCVALEDYYHQ